MLSLNPYYEVNKMRYNFYCFYLKSLPPSQNPNSRKLRHGKYLYGFDWHVFFPGK